MKRSLEQTLGELADVVLAHAREHYSDPKYGWDHVVEAWERSGVMEFAVENGCKTLADFIKVAEPVLEALRSRDGGW
jgi:hypothetical protein